MKKIFNIILFIILVLLAGVGGYWYGNREAGYPKSFGVDSRQVYLAPSFSEIDSVYQDPITFATSINQSGRDKIAEIIDGVKLETGIDFDRSYANNPQLYWERPDNIEYLSWLSLSDQEKVDTILACQNNSSCIGNNIRYRMETVLATKDVSYTYNEAQELLNVIRNYLVNEKGFVDGAYDVAMGNPNAVLIKGNLICKISFEPGGFGLVNVNNEKISKVKIEFGYYDEPQLVHPLQ